MPTKLYEVKYDRPDIQPHDPIAWRVLETLLSGIYMILRMNS